MDIDGLSEGQHTLIERKSENYSAQYLVGGGVTLEGLTSSLKPGTLTITRFDDKDFIVSGTFEFTVLDNEGNEIQITDGPV